MFILFKEVSFLNCLLLSLIKIDNQRLNIDPVNCIDQMLEKQICIHWDLVGFLNKIGATYQCTKLSDSTCVSHHEQMQVTQCLLISNLLCYLRINYNLFSYISKWIFQIKNISSYFWILLWRASFFGILSTTNSIKSTTEAG